MSELAVAVVDESILSMTGFETPTLDILGKFLLPLGVFTGDLRLDLLKQTPVRPVPERAADRRRRRRGLLARSGHLQGAEGLQSRGLLQPCGQDRSRTARASVKFTFPDSMTTYRVYAVACDKGSRFGTFQRSALVVKDFYLEPGMPSFFTRGDRFRFSGLGLQQDRPQRLH